MGATLLLKISPPFGRIVRLTLTLCDLKIYHMNWERLKNDRKLMVILTAAVAAVLIIIAIIIVTIPSGKQEIRKEPRIINLTIDAPDDLPLEEKEKIVYDSLRKAGYSPAGVCGMMGSIAVESPEYDPVVINKASGAFGLFQWTMVGERQQKLKDFCRTNAMNWGSFEGQLAFAVYELTGGDPIACRLDDLLRNTDDAYTAAAEFTAGFERCIDDPGKAADTYTGSLYPEFYGQRYQGMANRINKAMNYYERFKDSDTEAEDPEINITIE